MNKMKKKFCLVLLLCPVFLFAATFTESKVEESSYHEEALTDSASSDIKKVALVIGNAKYKGTFNALSNPVNDAKDMQTKLKEIGFEVECITDADRKTMYDSFKKFYSVIKNADIALLYYSGHGIESSGENYFIPVESDIKSEADLDSDAIPVNKVVGNSLDAIGSNGGNLIVILDACRSNPLVKNRGADRGLAVVDAAPVAGYIIAYSCKPGSVAADGNGRHSPFTDSLLQHIDEPNTSFTDIMQIVRNEVMKATDNAQVPSLSLETSDRLFLNGAPKNTPWKGNTNTPSAGTSTAYIVIIVLLILILVTVIVLFLLLTVSGRQAVSVASVKIGQGVTAGKKKAMHIVSFVHDKVGKAKKLVEEKRSAVKTHREQSVQQSAVNAKDEAPLSQSAESLLLSVAVGEHLLVSATPVTVGQYSSLMGTASGEDDMLPVTSVDYYDVLSFLNALSLKESLEPVYDISDRENIKSDFTKNGWRLPPQKEWKAAAGKISSEKFDDSVWCSENSNGIIHPCGQKNPNENGLYDMYGLVWEWCADSLKENRRILKGGSWDADSSWCTKKSTEAVVPSYKSDNTGFRGVRSI